eukprot:Lithocolla_globosa_v1_NODE_7526_length_935_cov_3.389773.p2 type:complete len:100 gc:universal NODE_7526_length_935_cov_3.389773:524-823(+)
MDDCFQTSHRPTHTSHSPFGSPRMLGRAVVVELLCRKHVTLTTHTKVYEGFGRSGYEARWHTKNDRKSCRFFQRTGPNRHLLIHVLYKLGEVHDSGDNN